MQTSKVLFHDGSCVIPILLEVGIDWRSKTAGVRYSAGVFGQGSKQVLVLIGDSEAFRHTPNIILLSYIDIGANIRQHGHLFCVSRVLFNVSCLVFKPQAAKCLLTSVCFFQSQPCRCWRLFQSRKWNPNVCFGDCHAALNYFQIYLRILVNQRAQLWPIP